MAEQSNRHSGDKSANMYYCVVNGCYSDGTCLVSFHKLPEKLCPIWKKVIGRGEDFEPKKSQRICNLHFSSENLIRNSSRNRLRKGAVPTTDLILSSVVEGKEYIFVNFLILVTDIFLIHQIHRLGDEL